MVSLNRLKLTIFHLHAVEISPTVWLAKLRNLLILEMMFQRNIPAKRGVALWRRSTDIDLIL